MRINSHTHTPSWPRPFRPTPSSGQVFLSMSFSLSGILCCIFLQPCILAFTHIFLSLSLCVFVCCVQMVGGAGGMGLLGRVLKFVRPTSSTHVRTKLSYLEGSFPYYPATWAPTSSLVWATNGGVQEGAGMCKGRGVLGHQPHPSCRANRRVRFGRRVEQGK